MAFDLSMAFSWQAVVSIAIVFALYCYMYFKLGQ